MDIYEEAVMGLLVANGETFIAPQFDIDNRWSQPDFVAIRPPKKTVYVVEVSSAGYPTSLVKKVRDREAQWLSKLRTELQARKICGAGWAYRVLVFVRRDQFEWFNKKIEIQTIPDVCVLMLEDAFEHWLWDDRVYSTEFGFESDRIQRQNK